VDAGIKLMEMHGGACVIGLDRNGAPGAERWRTGNGVMEEGCNQVHLVTVFLSLPESRCCRTEHHDMGIGLSRIAGAF